MSTPRSNMGFGFDLVTRVDSVEENPNNWVVRVELARGAMMSRMILEMRARARAMIAVGLVQVAGERSRDVAEAIRNIDPDRIQRATEVVSSTDQIVTVRVNK